MITAILYVIGLVTIVSLDVLFTLLAIVPPVWARLDDNGRVLAFAIAIGLGCAVREYLYAWPHTRDRGDAGRWLLQ